MLIARIAWVRYHLLHGSAKQSVKDGLGSKWQHGNVNTSQLRNLSCYSVWLRRWLRVPVPWVSVRRTQLPSLVGIRPLGVAPRIREIYTSCDFLLPACNKTSLSRKPCIADKTLLWNAFRKSWLTPWVNPVVIILYSCCFSTVKTQAMHWMSLVIYKLNNYHSRLYHRKIQQTIIQQYNNIQQTNPFIY